uniref:Secreted protein n=1 Tax=Nothoprocta perdicaria TaxID=30464 RepID=A0A8C6Z3Q3_NOTPE
MRYFSCNVSCSLCLTPLFLISLGTLEYREYRKKLKDITKCSRTVTLSPLLGLCRPASPPAPSESHLPGATICCSTRKLHFSVGFHTRFGPFASFWMPRKCLLALFSHIFLLVFTQTYVLEP